MPSDDADLDIPELPPAWFASAVQPNRAALRRGSKRAVFVEAEIADRFRSDEELENALRALIEAADHVKKTG